MAVAYSGRSSDISIPISSSRIFLVISRAETNPIAWWPTSRTLIIDTWRFSGIKWAGPSQWNRFKV